MEPSDVLTSLAGLIDQVLPGARRQAPAMLSYNGGFAIAVPGGGQVLVSAASGDPWFLTVTAGLAANVQNISGALSWTNSRNSDFSFGRFYVSLPADSEPRGNVVWQDQFMSQLLDQAPSLVSAWLPMLLKLAVDVTSNETAGVQSALGGQPFSDSDEDRLLLAAASQG